VKVFWALEDRLAYERHFPAINCLVSYSLYLDKIAPYWREAVGEEFRGRRDQCMKLLQRESELAEIARLVGVEALSPEEQVVMETAKSIREDFLQQNAFRDDDQFTSLAKQDRLLKLILLFHEIALAAHGRGAPLRDLFAVPVRERITRAKYLAEDQMGEFGRIEDEIEQQLMALCRMEGE